MNSTVSILPLYQDLEPFVVNIAGALALALLTWLVSILRSHLAILQTTQAQALETKAEAAVQQAAMNAAGRILAAQEGNIASIKFGVGSAAVAAEVPKVLNYVASEATVLGITPAHVGDLITAKIGILQAGAPAAAVPISPVVVASKGA